MHLKDEIATRAKRLLHKAGKIDYGVENHFSSFMRVGNYALHWDDGYGLTINDHGDFHGTIFRMSGRGSTFEQTRPEQLPALLEALRNFMVLDDLADV